MNDQSAPRVSIVVLNWNGLKDTVECLNSLARLDYPDYEIIVVDNASRGNDAAELRRQFGQIAKIITNDQNYGFAKGNNIAIQQILSEAKSDFILLLNNDTVVKEDFLTELIKASQTNLRAAIFGPKMFFYNYQGRRDVICSAAGSITWSVSPGYIQKDKFKHDSELTDNSIREADWVSGACLLIHAKRINPLLNEKYYFGCEDIDKCLEAKKLGLTTLYVPQSTIWHKVSASRQRSFRYKIREFKTSYALMRSHNKFWLLATPLFLLTTVTKYIKKRL